MEKRANSFAARMIETMRSILTLATALFFFTCLLYVSKGAQYVVGQAVLAKRLTARQVETQQHKKGGVSEGFSVFDRAGSVTAQTFTAPNKNPY